MTESRRWDILLEDGWTTILPDYTGVLELTESNESSVPNAPIEDGSFNAYNKILLPKRISVKIGCGGGPMDRVSFDTRLRELQGSLAMLAVCSETCAWSSLTIESYSKSSSEGEGVYLCIYDIEFVEVVRVRLSEAKTKDVVNSKVVDSGRKQSSEVNQQRKEKLEEVLERGER